MISSLYQCVCFATLYYKLLSKPWLLSHGLELLGTDFDALITVNVLSPDSSPCPMIHVCGSNALTVPRGTSSREKILGPITRIHGVLRPWPKTLSNASEQEADPMCR